MGCWQEAVQVLDDMTEKVLSLHMFCLQCCWVNTVESNCNLAEACMGIIHAAVAAYITGAIQNIVGGLLSW
jgi:ethanolamine ammonia-lyase large subunit